MKLNRILLALTFIFVSSLLAVETFAKVRIVSSLSDFGAIAKEIGGGKVEVRVLAKGYQDPHFVDPKPNYILYLNRADLLLYNGLGLEIGWLPLLITGSRNSAITSMKSLGHFDLSTLVTNVLEVPTTRVDRSMGDIHILGNPHYMLDPTNGVHIAKGIAERLSEVDPDNASYYKERSVDFVNRLTVKIDEWESAVAPWKGSKIVTYHNQWAYLSAWAGLNVIGYIESKPGIPPSPSHVARLIRRMNESGVNVIISAPFYPQRIPGLVAKRSGATLLVLPTMVDGREGVNTYFDLFDVIVRELTSALKKGSVGGGEFQ